MLRQVKQKVWVLIRFELVVLAVLALCAVTAHAQKAEELSGGSGASYVTPFPPGDIYKLQVFGDWVAEGFAQGLQDIGKSLDRVDLPKKPRLIQSLVRAEAEDDLKAEEQSKEAFQIAIILIGYNDRGSLRAPGSSNPVRFGTATWKEQYAQRFDRLLKALKKRGMAVYVLSLPPLRRPDANSDIETIGEALLERSQANGIRYIETAESFSDENGAFTQFGPDINGNREKLRDGDGTGFTAAGHKKMASLVVNEIKRDLASARSERAVPLAGGEQEQRRINPEKAAAASWKNAMTRDGRSSPPTAAQSNPSPAMAAVRAAAGQGDQKAESARLSLKFATANGREETAAVELVRPAVPAAVIALVTRKENVETAQPRYDVFADDIGGGISVSTMVAAVGDGSNASNRRRSSNNFANYTAVWVKGERLAPKPGRADDFTWPRKEAWLPAPAQEPAPVGPAAPPTPPRGRALQPKG